MGLETLRNIGNGGVGRLVHSAQMAMGGAVVVAIMVTKWFKDPYCL